LAGWMLPSVVEKVICVPECGGVPEASITCATIFAVALIGNAVASATSVIVDPDGASKGTFWQPFRMNGRKASAAHTGATRRKRANMRAINILIPMRLRGQATRQAGYAMAVLLVAMSVMAVMLTVALPVWKQASQREKEEELVFRGKQYAHAIGLFQRKYANAYPPNFDVLVTERFLRKKYKDPITNDDFAPILAGQNTGNTQPGGRGATGATGGNAGPSLQPAPAGAQPPNVGGRGGTATPGGPVGGIMGVTSKSKEQSIRLYNGRSHYNEWQFVYVAAVQAPGAGGAPGAPGAGQRGGQGGPQTNPMGPGPIGGQRGGRGGNGPGRGGPGGPGGPGGQPNRGGPGTFNPFQPNNPQQPILPGRGRG